MKILFRALTVAAAASCWLTAAAVDTNPKSVTDLLNRVGGAGTADRLVTVVDESLSTDGRETFVLTSSNGKPCIKGSTLSALTTGIGWYLNHNANVNLTWNNLTTDLSAVDFPLPAEETHTTTAEYRYYLNYCTFSYSMSTWTWERWQQEIDWMALRGINMPLQIVGLEDVWRKLLMEDFGYSAKEANDFIGGPSFMAWFGMNNQEGWGGPNPDWWYERQADLGRKMSARMRELGIEPVLPGFAGMVPSNFTNKTGIAATSQGKWCGFQRPYILDATGNKFPEVAEKYYARLKEVMGESRYYSIDPFHEGGAAPANVDLAYENLYKAMDKAIPGSHFVIQSWQWSGAQRKCLDNVPKGKLLVLDLYSDGNPLWNNYKGHETVYCTIFNFGGRTGFFGRFNGIIDGYFNARNTASVKGIGAAPEAIEQTPVMYDLLFELPWMASKPDASQWMADYAARRYGADSPEAREAWELLRTSALDCRTSLQGPHEAIVCSRPALTVNKVSSWGGADIFYDRSSMVKAAYDLMNANLSGENYSYDLADISRQALTDYSKSLLDGIRQANADGNTELFNQRRDAFLQLILDIDRLLSTNSLLTLGHWTERARAMASEAAGTTDADRNWLELDNARTLISTWGPQAASEGGGLRDYSYREWGGMLKDFYYQRWKTWFDNGMKVPSGGWFQWEWDWAHSNPGIYSAESKGNTRTVAAELLPKYLTAFYPSKVDGGAPYYIDRLLTNDATGIFFDNASPEETYSPLLNAEIAEIAIDFSKNNRFEESEVSTGGSFAIPADAPLGERTCRITLIDGTVMTFTLRITAQITSPRTITVMTTDPAQGTVSIDGTSASSVTNTDYVTVRATAASLYDFDHWEDLAGNNLGNDNPMTYYGKENATFKAFFVINKWGVPETNGYADKSTIAEYKQYVKSMTYSQNGETVELYSTNEVPDRQFVQIPTRIKAAPGGEFSFNWTDAGGLKWLFLSAYVDLNSDGTFEMDRNSELLGTFGEYKNNNNPEVAAGEFKVLLPYETKIGTTHIRLRFDSSWNEQAWNSEVKCFRPDGYTNRFVYELLLEVVDSPDYACTVTYGMNNSSYGSMRSENETMVYNPGETVIITAFPNPGCRVKRWVDNHGRELPAEWVAEDGLSVSFKAFDNAHITAEFETLPMQVSGWTLGWEAMDNGLARVTSVIEEGDAHLNLSAATPAIGAINAGVFASCKNLTEVTLPDNELTEPGAVIFTTSIVGDGTRNKLVNLTSAITGTDSWVMLMDGTADGSTFNDYGSALYGNGTDALAENFSNGWSQFFLKKNGNLSVKWDSGTEVVFDQVNLNGNFKIRSSYDASTKKITITVSNGLQSQTKEIANTSTMQPISRFATALPKGINYTLTFSKPDAAVVPGTLFAGCRNIESFHCVEGSALFTERNGALYKKNSSTRVLAYPEGRLSRPFVLKQGTSYVAAAPVAESEGFAAESLKLNVSTTLANPLAALWSLGSDNYLVHANSALKLNSKADAVEATGAQLTYQLTYGSSMPSLKVTPAGGTVKTFKFEEYQPVVTAAPSVVTFPFAVVVPEGAEVCYVSSVDAEKGPQFTAFAPGDVLCAGQAIVVRATQANSVVFNKADAATAEAVGIMVGSTVDRTLPQAAFVAEGSRFVKSSAVGANSAYIPAELVPASLGDSFALDWTQDGITDIFAPEADGKQLYDLSGRRVSTNPRSGIYITSDGQKTIIR